MIVRILGEGQLQVDDSAAEELNDLDAKLEMYVRCLMKDKETGAFTARDPVFGQQLFKGRKA